MNALYSNMLLKKSCLFVDIQSSVKTVLQNWYYRIMQCFFKPEKDQKE